MQTKAILLLAIYNSLIAGLVLYSYFLFGVNPVLFNVYAVLVSIVSWIALVKNSVLTAPGLLIASWITLGIQYYYLGYSGQDLATSLGQDSDTIMFFNFVIAPIAVIVTLLTALFQMKRSKR